MKKYQKRSGRLSMLLIVMMLLSLLPGAAWAEGEALNDVPNDSVIAEGDDAMTPNDPTDDQQVRPDLGQTEVGQGPDGDAAKDGDDPAAAEDEKLGEDAPEEDESKPDQQEEGPDGSKSEENGQLQSVKAELALKAEVPPTLTPDDQDKWQAIIDENAIIYIAEGVYEDMTLHMDSAKTLVPQGEVIWQSTDGSNHAIVLQDGADLTIEGASGAELTITGYMNGIYVENNARASIHVAQNNKLYLKNSRATENNNGNGIYALYNVDLAITAEEGAVFAASDNDTCGINVLSGQVDMTFSGCESVDLSRNALASGYHTGMDGVVRSHILFTDCAAVHVDNNGVDAFCFSGNEGELKFVNCPNVTMNNNSVWGTNGGHITLQNSTVDCSGNSSHTWDQVKATASNMYCYTFTAEDAILTVNDCQTYTGLWVAGDAVIRNSQIEAKNNGVASTTLGYGIYIKGTADIDHSTVTAEGNGKAGVVLVNKSSADNHSAMTDGSVVITKNNGLNEQDDTLLYRSGIVLITGHLDTSDSVLITNEPRNLYGFSFHNIGANGTWAIQRNMVAALAAEDTQSLASDASRSIVMTGGSLQGDREKMTGEYGDTLNGVKAADEVYAAPINADGTKLTQFVLHKADNLEVGEPAGLPGGLRYYDPAARTMYDYEFRFNEAGEDLEDGVSGNAYVWTPVSVIHYDAAESLLGELGTALSADDSGRYASDTTIYGNSLRLAERQMPSWASYVDEDGNTHTSGWYVHTENGRVMDISDRLPDSDSPNACQTWDEFYALLDTPFTEAVKVCTDFQDPATAIEEITVYAKWTITPPAPPIGPVYPVDPIEPGGSDDPVDHPPTEPSKPIVIPEVEVPLAEIPAIPATELPAEIVIPDEPMPLAETPVTDNPKTGAAQANDLSVIALLLAAGALGITFKRKRA